MKYIFIFTFFISSLLSASINDSLLKIHATIVPKISLMDYEFEDKIFNNEIVIAIYSEQTQHQDAIELKNKILSKYQNGIKDYTIRCEIISYNEKKYIQSNIVYLFPTTAEKIIQTTKMVKKFKPITFSYLEEDLKNNVMLSVNISSNVKPIINLDVIKNSNITLRPILLKISQRF